MCSANLYSFIQNVRARWYAHSDEKCLLTCQYHSWMRDFHGRSFPLMSSLMPLSVSSCWNGRSPSPLPTYHSYEVPDNAAARRILDVPHYYVLPYFAMMEHEELVTRAERVVGILTTAKGSRKMIELMHGKILKESSEILGMAIS